MSFVNVKDSTNLANILLWAFIAAGLMSAMRIIFHFVSVLLEAAGSNAILINISSDIGEDGLIKI